MSEQINPTPEIKALDLLDLTYRGLCEATWLQSLQRELKSAKEKVERIEADIRKIGRDYAQVNAELHARGYHDVGHARSEFESKVVDGKRVPLPAEEQDPRVRHWQEQVWIYK